MVFLLGFLVSGLLTLLFLPAFWRRAVRLSTRRLEMQMPLSMGEIVAERDQLRAGYALEQRRLEQKTEALGEAHARDLGEIGRRAILISRLEQEVAEARATLSSTENDLAERSQDFKSALVETGAVQQAHWDLSGRAEAQARALAELEDAHGKLVALADERRVSVAGLETRTAGLEMRLEDLQRRVQAAENELVEKKMNIAALTQDRDALRIEAGAAVARRDQLMQSAIEQNQRISELERAHRIERRERTRLENEAASNARALADALAQQSHTEAAVARQLEEVAARERPMQQEIEHLRAEKSALEGALDVTRREFTALRAVKAETAATVAKPAVSAEDALRLRQSISEIGAEVARLASKLQEEADENALAGAPPKSAAERVRELQSRAKRAVPSH